MICSLWRLDTALRTYIAVEASFFWSEPFGHTWVVVCHIPTDFYIPPVYNVDGD